MLLITLFACLCWAHGEQALGHVVSLNWVCSDHWHKLWRKLGSWKNWTVRWKAAWPRKRKRQVRRSKKPSLLTLVLSAFKAILVCGDISVIVVIKVARIDLSSNVLKLVIKVWLFAICIVLWYNQIQTLVPLTWPFPATLSCLYLLDWQPSTQTCWLHNLS